MAARHSGREQVCSILPRDGDHLGAGRASPPVPVGGRMPLLRRPSPGRARTAGIREALPPAAHRG
eukprot:5405365-Pyramimonas_sp.AAC.1